MKRYWFIGLLLWIASAPPVSAQLPNPVLPREPDPLPPSQPEPTAPDLVVPDPPVAPPVEIPGTIWVERFEFEGNTAFSDRQLAEVTQPFVGREISFAELLQAEAAVAQLYTTNGFINSGAVIPAGQTLSRSGAIVTVQVIEGGVEAIQVSGNRRLDSAYVRSRLALATRTPLNRDRLLEALQLLQLDPLIETISAELQAGTRPEQSLLVVRIQEADSSRVEVFADDGRSPSVGEFRRGITLEQRNLTGLGDRLELTYTNTEGSSQGDVSYTVPLNPRNGTLQARVSLSDTRVVEEPFEEIDITGDSRLYDLTYRQPIVQTPNQEFALGLTFSRSESETFLLGEPFPLSPGSNAEGETRITTLRVFQEFVQRNAQDVFAARSQFNIGLDWFDATRNTDAPDSRFLSWRGQAQYVRSLAPDTFLLVRSDVQLADDDLVPLEQFGVGGLNSVRGYRQDALLTNNGLLTSVEVQLPVLRVPDVNGVLQIVPFLDLGIGWDDTVLIPDASSTTLVSTGVGLLWRMGDSLLIRLDYSIPLTDLASDSLTQTDDRFYFQFSYSPF
ncbi:ShlB/FhaC/HecB family hemolysin secretion/activation protein [Oscillatoria sp. FACHB-1407]|uniref:ShlB/FhaC/HecB family hemolysin secretion/activation protein n=1 Tax=Oscillatoria sp. FACHB-1407 TaxID=2692847 RepID=UPI0016842A20|nr:ShlB/FhaC/HecB family hemolysin secretion/activation protein [Oscillatoria sp. FACHB-1407]MBD2465120.1 ShlB/FhaC/HecB family hemolysin secretion/activation protein [Oscillatoria sp. FACHB-1407]